MWLLVVFFLLILGFGALSWLFEFCVGRWCCGFGVGALAWWFLLVSQVWLCFPFWSSVLSALLFGFWCGFLVVAFCFVLLCSSGGFGVVVCFLQSILLVFENVCKVLFWFLVMVLVLFLPYGCSFYLASWYSLLVVLLLWLLFLWLGCLMLLWLIGFFWWVAIYLGFFFFRLLSLFLFCSNIFCWALASVAPPFFMWIKRFCNY